MKLRKELNEISLIIDKLVNIICVILTFIMFFSVFFQIIGRYVISGSIAWTEELARFCMIWLAFLGASTLVRNWENTSITFVKNKFRQSTRKILEICIVIVMLVFMTVIFYLAVTQIPRYSLYEKSPALMISMLVPKSSIIFGSLFVVVQLLWKLADMILEGKEEEK